MIPQGIPTPAPIAATFDDEVEEGRGMVDVWDAGAMVDVWDAGALAIGAGEDTFAEAEAEVENVNVADTDVEGRDDDDAEDGGR